MVNVMFEWMSNQYICLCYLLLLKAWGLFAKLIIRRYLVPSPLTVNLTFQLKCQGKGHDFVSCREASCHLRPFAYVCLRNFETICGTTSFDIEVDLKEDPEN